MSDMINVGSNLIVYGLITQRRRSHMKNAIIHYRSFLVSCIILAFSLTGCNNSGCQEAVSSATCQADRSQALFNGKDLEGWVAVDSTLDQWAVENGVLKTSGQGGGWIRTTGEYSDFEISLDFKVSPGSNSGLFLRAPEKGNPAYAGMEIQVLDDHAQRYAKLKPYQYTGSIYAVQPPSERVTRGASQWQTMKVRCVGSKVQVRVNGKQTVGADLNDYPDKFEAHPGLKRRSGYIGLQNHSPGKVEFRNVIVLDLSK